MKSVVLDAVSRSCWWWHSARTRADENSRHDSEGVETPFVGLRQGTHRAQLLEIKVQRVTIDGIQIGALRTAAFRFLRCLHDRLVGQSGQRGRGRKVANSDGSVITS